MDELTIQVQELQRNPTDLALYKATIDRVMEEFGVSKSRAKKLLLPLVRDNHERGCHWPGFYPSY